jgi:DNA-binding transcriptional LysR family regulator
VICASPDYLSEHGRPVEPRELANHNCLLFDYLTGDTTWTLTRGGKSEKVSVSGNLRATGSELLREAAIGGIGLLLMPTWLVGNDIVAGRLVPVLEQWSPTPGAGEGAIWAVYLPNRRGSKKLACFLDFLAQHFGTPAYWDRYGQGEASRLG